MTTWIKPAVGWGIVYENKHVCHFYASLKPIKSEVTLTQGETLERVAIVPYTVARKAGLLRRPK